MIKNTMNTVLPGVCEDTPDDEVMSVAAVDKVLVVVVAEDTPSSESPLDAVASFGFRVCFFRGLRRDFVGDSNSSVLATSLPALDAGCLE